MIKSAVVANFIMVALPLIAVYFPAGASAKRTPREKINRHSPSPELERFNFSLKSGIREMKFPELNPRAKKESVTPRCALLISSSVATKNLSLVNELACDRPCVRPLAPKA